MLVEYADFECPYCAMAEPYLENIVNRFGDRVGVDFRPFPLAEIHPHAMHAAQAAEAAGLQNRFWEMHDILFKNQKRLDDPSLQKYAQEIGLDIDRFKRDFDSRAVLDDISESISLGNEDGVPGTPTFFLNGELLDIDAYEDLEKAVAQAAGV